MTRALTDIQTARKGMTATRFRQGEMAKSVRALPPESPDDLAHYENPRLVLRNRQVIAAAMLLADIERMDAENVARGAP